MYKRELKHLFKVNECLLFLGIIYNKFYSRNIVDANSWIGANALAFVMTHFPPSLHIILTHNQFHSTEIAN